MKVVIFNKNTKKGQFTNYGYGKLRLIQKCEITDELNGRYDLELVVSREDPKAHYLKKWVIVYVDGQLFRISDKYDNDKENTVNVFAKHIFYDINFGFIEDSRVDKKTVQEAMQVALPDDFKSSYEVSSDITDTNTLYFVKNYGADSMFEIMERWSQGEIIRDNFKIAINKNKGKDNGVTFTYKKIDAIEIKEDPSDVVTRLYPTGKDGVSLQEKYIYIPNWNEEDYLPFHITREVKFEDAENEGDLRILAQKEAEKIGASRINFTIKVNDLADTNLYKLMPSLMKVETGDTVTIKHSKLNVRVKVKCIKKVHEKVSNELQLEFGQPFSNFFDSIDNSKVEAIVPDTTALRNELFYYFNGAPVVMKATESRYASMKVATSKTTNLMLHLTINPLVTVKGRLSLRVVLNNEEVQYSPIVDLIEGYSIQTISFPLIAVPGGQTQVVRVLGTFTGQGTIEMNRLHFSITGQDVNKGLIKVEPFTGALIEFTVSNRGISPKTDSNIKLLTFSKNKVINNISIVPISKTVKNIMIPSDVVNIKGVEK